MDRIVRESEKAFLIEIDNEEIWIPFSQIADCDQYEAGDENITISITEFIAREKGIEGD